MDSNNILHKGVGLNFEGLAKDVRKASSVEEAANVLRNYDDYFSMARIDPIASARLGLERCRARRFEGYMGGCAVDALADAVEFLIKASERTQDGKA
jgi:hypothetical protein